MDYENIADAVRSHRRDLGLTQAEVALLAELDRRTLSDFENATGNRGLSLRNLLRLCDVLGLAVTVAPRTSGTER